MNSFKSLVKEDITMSVLTCVVPCYNEEQVIPLFYNEIEKVKNNMTDIDFELLFIDDGSVDNTLEIIKELSINNEQVKYISFSRNFGKEAAIYAGLKNSSGNYIALIDADLQHPPHLLCDMYNIIIGGGGKVDCVATRRISRKGEFPIQSFFSSIFYKLFNRISRIKLEQNAQDYRLMTRQMVNSILEISEYNRFSKGIFSWVGYNTKWIECEDSERAAGKTKWSFWSLLLYSIEGIVAFSTIPLAMSSIIGLLFCFIAFLMVIFFIIKTLIWGDPVAGYPSLICIIFFISGVQLFCMGILGQYLSKTYLETKNRPIYVSKEDNIDER